VLTDTGNIGIGTGTPDGKLDVLGGSAFLPAPNAAPADGNISNSQWTLWLDESSDEFELKAKKSDGSVITQTVGSGSGGSGDFLANGTVPMTGNLRLSSQWLSNDGSNQGIRIDNSGRVGMGTATPATRLEVSDVVASARLTDTNDTVATNSLFSYLEFFGSDGSLGWVGDGASGSNDISLSANSSSSNGIKLITSASTRVQVLANGNVGIGTETPARRLQVEGPMRLTASTVPSSPAAGDMYIDSADSNKLKYYNGSTWVEATGSAGAGDFFANGSVEMTGNIDLGGQDILDLGLGSASAPSISFTGVDTNTGIFSPSPDMIALTTAGNEALRIDASGNVGIGTDNPGRLLQVDGPMRITASTVPSSPVAGDIYIDSADSNKLKYYDGSLWVDAGDSGAGLTFSCPGGFTKIVAGGRTLGCMQTAEANSGTGLDYTAAQDFCFDNFGGRVPTYTEWYVAMDNYTLTDEVDTHEWTSNWHSSGAALRAGNGSLSISGNDLPANPNEFRCWVNATVGGVTGKFVEGTVATNAVYNLGNVGIGTASPSNILHTFSSTASRFQRDTAAATGTFNSIYAVTSNSAGAGADNLATGVNFLLETETDGTVESGGYISVAATDATAGTVDGEMRFVTSKDGTGSINMVIDPDGNVGIGANAPDNPLVVLYSSTGANEGITADFQSSSTDGAYIAVTESGTKRWLMGLDDSSTTLKIREDRNTGDTAVAINDAGNVGIGTSTPARKLHVEGPMRLTAS
ncbi:MAG: hypothetical protein HRT44_11115, partial [Bdellovibrionales bacterium]|nr:hypothetical protein [Bdellovibrionales bacterium]